MDRKDVIYEDVRRILVETLGLEPDEVTLSANFFHDLGGESIDVLDLTFRCEKKYGTTIRFQELTDSNIAIGSDGTIPEAALKELQERFPFLDFGQFQSEEATPASSLFTVDTIVRFVEHSLAQNDSVNKVAREADLT